jgi:hypothetical protein
MGGCSASSDGGNPPGEQHIQQQESPKVLSVDGLMKAAGCAFIPGSMREFAHTSHGACDLDGVKLIVSVFDSDEGLDEWVAGMSGDGSYFAVGARWGAVAVSRSPVEKFAAANSGKVIAP